MVSQTKNPRYLNPQLLHPHKRTQVAKIWPTMYDWLAKPFVSALPTEPFHAQASYCVVLLPVAFAHACLSPAVDCVCSNAHGDH